MSPKAKIRDYVEHVHAEPGRETGTEQPRAFLMRNGNAIERLVQLTSGGPPTGHRGGDSNSNDEYGRSYRKATACPNDCRSL